MIRKGFESFECKFDPLERDGSIRMQTRSIQMQIRSLRMQIRTIRKGFEAF